MPHDPTDLKNRTKLYALRMIKSERLTIHHSNFLI